MQHVAARIRGVGRRRGVARHRATNIVAQIRGVARHWATARRRETAAGCRPAGVGLRRAAAVAIAALGILLAALAASSASLSPVTSAGLRHETVSADIRPGEGPSCCGRSRETLRPAAHACRFWGLVGCDYPGEMITDHLRDGQVGNLKDLGAYNDDGWGFACFLSDSGPLTLNLPLIRRGGPPASHAYDPDYDLAVEELSVLRPRAVLGNVRLVAVLHEGVPDPHPFQHEGMVFVHSGNIMSVSELEDSLLTKEYLEYHPPDYKSPALGSELYFLYLLKVVHQHPGLSRPEALCRAVLELSTLTQDDRLDFVLTAGDTLYALRFAGSDEADPLAYCPADSSGGRQPEASPYWAAATQVLGSDAGRWGTIPARTLGVFVPGQAPQFHPIEEGVWHGQESSRQDGTGSAAALKVRFWGLVGSDYPEDLIADHLRDGTVQNLKGLGGSNSEGWGLASYPPDSGLHLLNRPVIRRGGPPASDEYDPDYDLAVDELSGLKPRAALGHVRYGSSGHWGLPDPHPFQHEGMIFGHNGTIGGAALLDYLTGDDPDYLDTHPPDYQHGYIDSELYFLYLLKFIHQHPELSRAEGLRQAVLQLSAETGSSRLNFVMTGGDTLYALRYNDAGSVHASFYPAAAKMEGEAQPYWVVASQKLGRYSSWGSIPQKTLGVFVPGQSPAFYPIDGDTVPQFSISWLEVAPLRDLDGDGWASQLDVRCDPDVEWGRHYVSLTVRASSEGQEWPHLISTKYQSITGTCPDTIHASFWVPDSLPPMYWDLRVELYASGQESAVVVVDQTTHPLWGLSGVRVEGCVRDTVPDLPREFSFSWVGRDDEVDEDGDGFVRSFRIRWDADLLDAGDSAEAYVTVEAFNGQALFQVAASAAFWVRGQEADTASVQVSLSPAAGQSTWQGMLLKLFDAEPGTLAVMASQSGFSALGEIQVEGADHDEPFIPPDWLHAWVGAARPNPGRETILIPVRIPSGGAVAWFEVCDVEGRLVWKNDPAWMDAGETELIWDGRDRDGIRVPAGSYFLDIHIGTYTRQQRYAALH